jgi:hypothetical protein
MGAAPGRTRNAPARMKNLFRTGVVWSDGLAAAARNNTYGTRPFCRGFVRVTESHARTRATLGVGMK